MRMTKGADFPLGSSKRRAAFFGLLVLVARSRISFASSDSTSIHQHHQSRGSLGLHPSPHYEGPLAPGLQVSGGSRLKKAAARRVRAFRNMSVFSSTVSTSTEEQKEDLSQSMDSQVYFSTEASTDTTINQSESPTTFPTTQLSTTATTTTTRQPKQSPITHDTAIPQKAIVYMALLAIQFGIQPLLVRRFAPTGICKSSVVLVQELTKGLIAGIAYLGTVRPEVRKKELSALSVQTWLTVAGVPAAIYTVQNLASLLAYQNLEALTFNVLNQTKILWTALCCYFVMGKKQTNVQSLSLVLLLLSALVIEKVLCFQSIMTFLGGGGMSLLGLSQPMQLGRRFTHGVIPVLFASFLSGLAGALTQKNLQGITKSNGDLSNKRQPKNTYLFSMELTAASVIVLLASLLFSSDGKMMSENGFFYRWTPQTMIPILTNSFGGILVGMVTKHAGSVRKGFALIFGILLSGLLQAGSAGVSSAQVVGGLLAATSLWLHTTSGVRK